MDTLDYSERKDLKPALLIINPVSGKRMVLRNVAQIIRVLMDAGYKVTTMITGKKGDGTAFAASFGRDYQLVCCTGGDGTLNEVVNGVVGFPNAAITHFPGGSGNDAIKIFSETEPFFQLERLLDADEAHFDLIRCNDTYSINILSIGFDARVGTDIARFKRLPLVTGKGAYVLSILANMLHGLSAHYVVTLDETETVDAEQTMICICNGRWYGGGFNPVPEAEPDDGLLDVLLVKKVTLLQVPGVIGGYQKGRYADYPQLIRHVRCRRLRIRSDKPSVVNVDGEAIYTDDAQIELIPAAVRFFYPKGLQFRHKN